MSIPIEDFFVLRPFLALLVGLLVLIIVQTVSNTLSKRYATGIAIVSYSTALWYALISKGQGSSLLSPWIHCDGLAQVCIVLFMCIGISIACIATPFFRNLNSSLNDHLGEFYFLLTASLLGLSLICSARDFLILFLGFEIFSLSLYVLANYAKNDVLSQEGAIKYFLLGAVSTSLFIFGIALVYGAIGSTGFDAFATAKPLLGARFFYFQAGIALITVGLLFKAAIVPFHMWSPDVYSASTIPITAFMSVATKIGAFSALSRIFLHPHPQSCLYWNEALSFFACLTLIYASYVAMRQEQIKKFFAYSGMSHAGFLLLPLIGKNVDSSVALFFYLIVYSIATLGCFAVLTLIKVKNPDSIVLKDLQGLFYSNPVIAAIFSLCLFTLAGIPPTIGFFAKLYVFKVAFVKGYLGLIIVALLTTILSAYYYLRVVSVMLEERADFPEKEAKMAWSTASIGGIASLCIVLLSLYPDSLFNMLNFFKS